MMKKSRDIIKLSFYIVISIIISNLFIHSSLCFQSNVNLKQDMTLEANLLDSDSSETKDSTNNLEKNDAGKWILGENSVEDAIQSLKNKNFVILADNHGREGECDLVLAAQYSTPLAIAFMRELTSGILCAPMENDRLLHLRIFNLTTKNEDKFQTPFTMSIDSIFGTSGVSATDRSQTFNLLADEKSESKMFTRPGHVFPLNANDNGVFGRKGHTEGTVDLLKLAKLVPVGVIGEIVSMTDSTKMADLTEIIRRPLYWNGTQIPITTIDDIILYRREREGIQDSDSSAIN